MPTGSLIVTCAAWRDPNWEEGSAQQAASDGHERLKTATAPRAECVNVCRVHAWTPFFSVA